MEKWMRFSLALAVLVVGSSLVVAQEEEGEESETTITQAQLPPKVAQTVKEYGKGGEFVRAVKTVEDGVAVYEVTLKSGGKDVQVQTTLDGELNMREETIDKGDVPKAAVDRITKSVPGAKVLDAEKTLRSVYEVTVQDAKGRKAEVLVTPGGQLLEVPEAVGSTGENEKEEDEGKQQKQSDKKEEKE